MPATRNIYPLKLETQPGAFHWQQPYSTPAPSASPSRTNDNAQSDRSEVRGQHKGQFRQGKAGHILRPRNAFLFFRTDFNAQQQQSKQNQNNVSKQAGEAWKLLSTEAKAPYYALSRAENENYRKLYPQYKYTPRGKDGDSRSQKRGAGRTKRVSLELDEDTPDTAKSALRSRPDTRPAREKYTLVTQLPTPTPSEPSRSLSPIALPTVPALMLSESSDVKPCVDELNDFITSPLLIERHPFDLFMDDQFGQRATIVPLDSFPALPEADSLTLEDLWNGLDTSLATFQVPTLEPVLSLDVGITSGLSEAMYTAPITPQHRLPSFASCTTPALPKLSNPSSTTPLPMLTYPYYDRDELVMDDEFLPFCFNEPSLLESELARWEVAQHQSPAMMLDAYWLPVNPQGA